MALHVLETMEAIAASAETGAFCPVRSSFSVPEAVPADWDPAARTLVTLG